MVLQLFDFFDEFFDNFPNYFQTKNKKFDRVADPNEICLKLLFR